MKKIKIYPYKLGSESARELARELDTLCVKQDGNYKPYRNHIIINWGNSHYPEWFRGGLNVNMLNDPGNVELAVNKLRTLQILRSEDVPTPEWTTLRIVADRWQQDGFSVVERHNLTGSRGDGIVVKINHEVAFQELDNAPLYTKLIEKAREYRVHVFNGEVIDLQQKKRREGNDSDGTIKNIANGWVFVRQDITQPPEEINDIAIRAVNALGLDFGAVDIVTKEGVCYVLEVNTSPALEGTTLSKYINAIRRYASN